ncbi:MAG: hypothetical protein H6Q43_1680, partial [Deltaproteobacteria bacterium]|nr:hypothetical protein [Deltaproteobacteria bacterium]
MALGTAVETHLAPVMTLSMGAVALL